MAKIHCDVATGTDRNGEPVWCRDEVVEVVEGMAVCERHTHHVLIEPDAE